MISKERLEELIKQGATIYYFCGYKIHKINFLEIRPNKFYDDGFNYYIDSELGYEGKLLIFCEYQYLYEFETEEDARWELEMTATRTDTLKLPTWKEFIQSDKQIIFYNKDKTFYIDKVMNNTHIIIGYKCIIDLNEELEANRYNLDRKPATKENYIEACKLCLRLFKGEEV